MIRTLILVALLGVSAALKCRVCTEASMYLITGDTLSAHKPLTVTFVKPEDKCADATSGKAGTNRDVTCSNKEATKCSITKKTFTTKNNAQAAEADKKYATITGAGADKTAALAANGVNLFTVTEYGCAVDADSQTTKCTDTMDANAYLALGKKFINAAGLAAASTNTHGVSCKFTSMDGENSNAFQISNALNAQVGILAVMAAVVRALF